MKLNGSALYSVCTNFNFFQFSYLKIIILHIINTHNNIIIVTGIFL